MTRLAARPVSMDPQAIMDHHAKSFSWAARFLSAPARRDAALLYAYARTADDFADEEHLGTLSQRTEALQALRQQALETIDFGDRLPNPSLAHQTGCMLRRHGVPNIVLATLMDSLQTDAGARQIDSTESLLFFAYGVAGTVGQMMRPLLGAPPAADPHAIALGVAMQLTNIARDVVEDAQRGRCYIPAQWGVTMRIMSAPQNATEKNDAFAALQRLLALADDFYAYAHTGFSAIPKHNLRAIRVAAALYQGIGHKILQRGAHCYWQGRVSLNRFEKIKLLTRTLISPFDQGAIHVRDVWRDDLLHLVGLPGLPATES
jgi:phytoene synthase